MENTESEDDFTCQLLLMEGSILSDNDDESDEILEVVELRHPRIRKRALYTFSNDGSIIQEMYTFNALQSSWFIDDSVEEDGDVWLSTPIDPCFLILPYLIKAKESGKVIPLDDLLVDIEFPETVRLLKCSGIKNIHLLADRKGHEDLNAWAYNEEKTLVWLAKKAKQVSRVLKEKNIQLRDSGINAHDGNENDLLSYACGIVSEYIPDDLALKLLSHLNLTADNMDEILIGKRKSIDLIDNEHVKKPRKEIQSVGKQNKSSCSKDKSKIKGSSGCKSITSFFKKK